MRVQNYVRLPRGGTIRELLAQLNEQMASEQHCAAFIRTDADRRAYEENIAPIVRGLATCDELTRVTIEDGLKDGILVAMGYSSPESAPVTIPPQHWHFLELDYQKGVATAHAHGLAFYGIHIGLKEDLDKAVAATERQRHEREEASARTFSHSPDFGKVMWRGESFVFGPKQRMVVSILHAAAVRGEPLQPGKVVLLQVGSKDYKMGNLFRKHPAWGRLILSNGNGLYEILTE